MPTATPKPAAAATTAATDKLVEIRKSAEEIKKQIRDLLEEETAPSSAISALATQAIIDLIEDAMGIFEDYGNTFTPLERMRKNGLGIRNYGFTRVTYANARRNPQFVPSYLDMEAFNDSMDDFQRKRDIWGWLRQFSQLVRDGMRVPADAAFGYALEYYGALREAARRGVQGAEAEFNELRPFFKTRGNRGNAPVTEAQIERDLHALLHDKKDGEIVVRNRRPQLSGGVHEVVDEVHKDHIAAKETVEAEEKR